MNHAKAVQLEHLLRNLVEDATGKPQQRGAVHDGVTMDADSLKDDSVAIEGLLLAVSLLEQKTRQK